MFTTRLSNGFEYSFQPKSPRSIRFPRKATPIGQHSNGSGSNPSRKSFAETDGMQREQHHQSPSQNHQVHTGESPKDDDDADGDDNQTKRAGIALLPRSPVFCLMLFTKGA